MTNLALLQQVQANPGAYGFTAVTADRNCVASGCGALTISQQNRFVYDDDLHFTGGYQALIARYVANIVNAREGLPAPGELTGASARAFSEALINRLDAYRDLNAIAAAPGTGGPVSLFAEGVYAASGRNTQATSTGPNAAGYSTDLGGATVGAEYRVGPNLLVGAAFNYLSSNVFLGGRSSARVNLDSYQGGVFASASYPSFFVDGALTYGTTDFKVTRPGVIDAISSSPNGDGLTVGGKVGYFVDVAPFRVGPIAQLTYMNVRVGGYQEAGDPVLTLGVRRQSFDALTGGAGLQVRTLFPLGRGSASAVLNATAEHDFLDGVRTITSFGTAAPALLVNTGVGASGSALYGKLAGGMSATLSHGLSATASFSSTFGRSRGDERVGSAGLRYQF